MSLVTWQAIGAVVAIIFFLLAMFIPILKIGNRDDVSESAMTLIMLNFFIWGFGLMSVCATNWNTIGMGLFGVTR